MGFWICRFRGYTRRPLPDIKSVIGEAKSDECAEISLIHRCDTFHEAENYYIRLNPVYNIQEKHPFKHILRYRYEVFSIEKDEDE